MVCGDKTDFYMAIWNNYNDDMARSFIIQYMKKQKDMKICAEEYFASKEKQRRENYVYLKSALSAYKEDSIGLVEIKEILKKEIDTQNLSAYELNKMLHDDDRVSVGSSGHMLSGADIRSAIYKRIEAAEEYDRFLDNIIEILCQKYIIEDANTFFYNIGFSKRNYAKGKHSSPKVRRKNRGRSDESLDMFFEYQKYIHDDSDDDQVTQAVSKESDSAYEKSLYEESGKLYDILTGAGIDEDQGPVFVPIRIDPESGMGLFMIGRTLLDTDDEADKAGKSNKKKVSHDQNCYYCCLRFFYDEHASLGEYILMNETSESERYDLFRMTYSIEGGRYTDLSEAMAEYNNLITNKSHIEGYQELNSGYTDDIEEGGIDILLKYFASDDELSEIRAQREGERKHIQESMDMRIIGRMRDKEKVKEWKTNIKSKQQA